MLRPSVGPLGNAVTRAGGESHDWSGHFCEPGMVAMGNGLISERTSKAMAKTSRATKGDDLEARAKGGKS